MFSKPIIRACALVLCLLSLGVTVAALEVDCDSTYCFSMEDFTDQEPLRGICITDLPDANTGTVMLGTRVLRPGDILTVEQMSQMTFMPLRTEQDQEAMVTYLPIYENRVAPVSSIIRIGTPLTSAVTIICPVRLSRDICMISTGNSCPAAAGS